MKEWFRARNAWGVSIQTLTDEEAGRLMKALWEYTMTGHQGELRGKEEVIYALMLFTLRQDDENDQAIAIKRSASGTAGGRPRKANAFPNEEEKAKKANAFSDDDEKAKKANAFPDDDEKAKKANASNKNKNQNIEEEKEEDTETEYLFSRFWEAYPRHEAKEAAREAFTKLGVDEGLLETMITAIGKWKKTNQWKDEGGRYIPNPANWLRQRRWEDEVPKPAKPKATVIAQQYEQREYDEAYWAEYEAREQREIEEKIALMELEKNKEAGGEKG